MPSESAAVLLREMAQQKKRDGTEGGLQAHRRRYLGEGLEGGRIQGRSMTIRPAGVRRKLLYMKLITDSTIPTTIRRRHP